MANSTASSVPGSAARRWLAATATALVLFGLVIGGIWWWLDRRDRQLRAEVTGALERLGRKGGMTIEGDAEGAVKPTLAEVVTMVGREPDEPPALNRPRSSARWTWSGPFGEYSIYLKFAKDKSGAFRLDGGRTTGF